MTRLDTESELGHLAQINEFLKTDDIDRAIVQAREALTQHPDSVRLVCKFAAVLRRAGRMAEALELLQDADKARPGTIPIMMALAETMSHHHDLSGATELYDRVLKDKPGHEDAVAARIDIALRTRDVAAALEHTHEAVARFPEHARFACRRAAAFRHAGRFAAARDFLASWLSVRPGTPQVMLDYASALHATGDLGAAQDVYDSILADAPNNEGALAGRVGLALQKEDFESALGLIELALERRPGDIVMACRRADALRLSGRRVEAHDMLATLEKSHPESVPVLLGLAHSLQALSQREEAALVFQRVLDRQPAHEGAWLGLVDLALREDDISRAERLCETALQLCPDHTPFVGKYAAVLRRAGRVDDAWTFLGAFIKRQPGNVPAMLGLAESLWAVGDLEGAAALFDEVLADCPGNKRAWDGRIEVALQSADFERGLAVCDVALKHCEDITLLVCRRAALLRKAGRGIEARELLEERHRARPGSLPIMMALAATLRELGDLPGAQQLYDRVIDAKADHEGAMIGLIDLLLQRGEVQLAVRRAAAAVERVPDSVSLTCKYAAALGRTGRGSEALDFLRAHVAARPSEIQLMMALAEMLRSLGESDSADVIYAKVLDLRPGHWPALNGAAGIALARGDRDTAIMLLRGPCRELAGSGASDARELTKLPAASRVSMLPIRALILAEILINVGDDGEAAYHVQRLAQRASGLSDGEVVRSLRLAERLGRDDLLARLLLEAGRRPVIQLPLAMAMLRLAHATERSDLACLVEQQLSQRVPGPLRGLFDADAALLLRGPFAALSVLRARACASSDPRYPEAFARVLMACGQAPLAKRYLRLCLRRWPDASSLRAQFLNACIASGRPGDAASWLERLLGTIPEAEMDNLRLHVLLEQGQRHEALDVIKRQVSKGRRPPGSDQHLRLVLSLGHLEEAEDVERVARRNASIDRTTAAHFTTSHTGALLTELRLYRLAWPDASQPPKDQTLVENNFHAACEVIAAWRREPADDRGSDKPSPVAKRVLQYWNDHAPPREVIDVVRSWESVPGWTHTLFSNQTARHWLADQMGLDHARAFTLARHVAEEADFLRLCLLWHGGGLYADADDLLIGQPDELVADGTRLILFREQFGAVANNVLYAPPRHAVLERAVHLAREALLRRDNDTVWLKTGPGLLTRAVASHVLADPAGAARDIDIQPQTMLYRHVKPHVQMPYKKTARYWNRSTAKVANDAVVAALSDSLMFHHGSQQIS